MRRISMVIVLLLSMIGILAACSGGDTKKPTSDNNNGAAEENTSGKTDSEKEDGSEDGDDLSSILETIEDAEDQLNLGLGETGSFVTTLGTYDMTVTSAEQTDYEYEGIESELDCWVILDITIKNTSDQPLNAEDVMSSMELTETEEGSGYMDAAGAFESVTEFEGDIEPGKEQSAQFIAYAYDSDTYYFRKSSGNVAAGSSNQVMWEISTSEMKQ